MIKIDKTYSAKEEKIIRNINITGDKDEIINDFISILCTIDKEEDLHNLWTEAIYLFMKEIKGINPNDLDVIKEVKKKETKYFA